MSDPLDLLAAATQYFQIVGIVLLGYCLFLRFKIDTKLDYLEKLLSIVGLGIIPYFIVLLILSMFETENYVIDSAIVSVIASSIYILIHYYIKRKD